MAGRCARQNPRNRRILPYEQSCEPNRCKPGCRVRPPVGAGRAAAGSLFGVLLFGTVRGLAVPGAVPGADGRGAAAGADRPCEPGGAAVRLCHRPAVYGAGHLVPRDGDHRFQYPDAPYYYGLPGGVLSRLRRGVLSGVFQNPMAAPDLLGASTGACFGAALAILQGRSSFVITLYAFSSAC